MNPHQDDLFISYNGLDDGWVRELAAVLEERLWVRTADGEVRPFKCFYYTRDIPPGQQFTPVMLARALEAPRTLWVVSTEFIASGYVRQEINSCLRRRCMDAVFPVSRRRHEWDGWQFQDINSAPAFDEVQTASVVERLADWLCEPQPTEKHIVFEPEAEPLPEELAIEEAWARLHRNIALVDGGAMLGCAVYSHASFFKCPASVGRAIQALREQGTRARLRWGSEPEIEIAQELVDDVCALLGCFRFGGFPARLEIAGEIVPFPTGHLGAAALADGALVPIPVAVRDWRKEGDLYVPDGVLPLTGSPIFDATARVAGFLDSGPGGSWCAIPAEDWLS